MIQFNLLPDVKLGYLKAERQKRMAISVSIIASIATFSIFALLVLVVLVSQRNHMNDVTNEVKETTEQIKKTKDINRMLTVQSQLNSLNTLHDAKPVTTRLYDYITRLTPAEVSISDIKLDFNTNTIEISGQVPTLAIVQKFVDTFKYTTYRMADNKAGETAPDPAAFTDVVLADFSRDEAIARYTLRVAVDPVIFSGAKDVIVTVPEIRSTDTTKERPTPIFQPVQTEDGAM